MSSEKSEMENGISNPEKWVDEYGDYLYRYALTRVRDSKIAEDIVQETFLAAFHARDTFSGKSSEKTWFVGILKHKIIDYYRKTSREQPVSDFTSEKDETIEELFDRAGHWKIGPEKWNMNPETVFEQDEFWEVFQNCLNKLQSRVADAFSLREIEGLDTQEVCDILNISKANLWVILHRARSRLRRCLEINWFGGKREK